MVKGETADRQVSLKTPVQKSNVCAILTVVLRHSNGWCMTEELRIILGEQKKGRAQFPKCDSISLAVHL